MSVDEIVTKYKIEPLKFHVFLLNLKVKKNSWSFLLINKTELKC